MSSYVLGVDVGGTFTDVFAFDREAGRFEIAKVASTPGAQAEGFMAGLEASGAPAASIETIVHGTTVATNAILERKGAKCGLIATRGFRDTLELGRRTRPNNWGLTGSFEALIPRELRLDVTERIDAKGRVLVPLDEGELRAAVTTLRDAGCEALVIHFIHAYANPAHERRAGEIARGLWPNAFVSTGAEVLAEIREFERASGAALNGWVQPLMARYVGAAERRLGEAGFAHRLLLMQGNGGMMSAPTACRAAAQTVLSGPAAGAIAAARLCRAAGFENVLACDMGGTSFDLTLIRDGQPATTTEKNMAYSVPLHLPLVDVHTIGSGGGSIARVDASGLLRVGPESAGAHPGPICYGRGGNAPTVTDANAILGRIDTASLAGGLAAADLERVRARMAETIGVPLGLNAEGAAAAVLAVAGNQMANAARMVSIEKGHDPREFILFAFGGAGPMHAVEIARELGIPKVLVPRFPGITSALGCVLADVRHDYVRSLHCPLADVDPALGRSVLAEQAAQGRALIESEGVAVTAVDMVHEADLLYRGQSHVFRVPIDDPGFDPERVRATFAAHYRRRFDIALPEMVPMLVNLRTTVIGRREPLDLASLSRTARDAGCFSSRSDAIDPLSRATGEAVGENAGAPRKGVRRVCFDGEWHEAAIVGRATLVPGMTVEGPAIIEQLDTTVPIEPGLAARVDGLGNLIIPVAPRAVRAAGVGAGTGAGSVARAGAGSVARAGAGSVARAGVGSVARAGVGSVARAGVGSVARAGAGSVAKAGAGSGAVTGSVARTGAGAGAGSRSGTGDTLDAVTLAVIQNGLGRSRARWIWSTEDVVLAGHLRSPSTGRTASTTCTTERSSLKGSSGCDLPRGDAGDDKAGHRAQGSARRGRRDHRQRPLLRRDPPDGRADGEAVLLPGRALGVPREHRALVGYRGHGARRLLRDRDRDPAGGAAASAREAGAPGGARPGRGRRHHEQHPGAGGARGRHAGAARSALDRGAAPDRTPRQVRRGHGTRGHRRDAKALGDTDAGAYRGDPGRHLPLLGVRGQRRYHRRHPGGRPRRPGRGLRHPLRLLAQQPALPRPAQLGVGDDDGLNALRHEAPLPRRTHQLRLLRPHPRRAPARHVPPRRVPAPVCGCAAEVSQRIMEALFGALGQAIPEDTFAGARPGRAATSALADSTPSRGGAT